MGDIEEIQKVLKERLQEKGVLDKIRSTLRAHVFEALNEQQVASLPEELSGENLIINELIRCYLEFNGYRETLSVFLPECGLPQTGLGEAFLADRLNVDMKRQANAQSLPLLYFLVAERERRVQGSQDIPNKHPATYPSRQS